MNFIYVGTTVEHTDTKIIGMEGKHNRHIHEFNPREGTFQKQRSKKHRYILIHGDKRFVKTVKSKLRYEILPYPKSDKTMYDSGQPINQIIYKQESLF